jgi:hypothetical protein
MPKRSRRKPAPKSQTTNTHQPELDANQAAFGAVQRLIELSEGTEGKNPMAVALGRLGGLKGGKARAKTMTSAQRQRSARKAAKARWAARKSR